MEHIIQVTLSENGEVITSPVVAPGDTVTWFFTGKELEGQNMEVSPKEGRPNPFNGPPSAIGQPNQISREIVAVRGESFEYNIFKNGEVLPWAGGPNGGCLKTMPPPDR